MRCGRLADFLEGQLCSETVTTALRCANEGYGNKSIAIGSPGPQVSAETLNLRLLVVGAATQDGILNLISISRYLLS